MTLYSIGRKMVGVGACAALLGIILAPFAAMQPDSQKYFPLAFFWLAWTGALMLGGMFLCLVHERP